MGTCFSDVYAKRMALSVSFSNFPSLVCSWVFVLHCRCNSLTTVVFPGVFRPTNPFFAAGGAISASFPHDMERTVAGSSNVAQGEDSASESLSVVTRSVVQSVLDVGSAGVP